MGKRKKFWGLSITLALVIAFFFIGMPKHDSEKQTAAGKQTKQVFKEKSLDESYKDALAGISDKEIQGVNELGQSLDDSRKSPNSKIELVNTSSDQSSVEDNNNPIVEEYETEQVLSQDTDEKTDTVIQEVVVTKFADVAIQEESDSENSSVITVSDKGDDKWDTSKGVKAYSRFYYTKSTVSGGDVRAKLTKVTGGWTVQDSSIKLSARTVTLGCSGWPAGNQSSTKKPTGNSFNYSASSSWKAKSIKAPGAIGVTTSVKLKRGSSTWTLKLTNNL